METNNPSHTRWPLTIEQLGLDQDTTLQQHRARQAQAITEGRLALQRAVVWLVALLATLAFMLLAGWLDGPLREKAAPASTSPAAGADCGVPLGQPHLVPAQPVPGLVAHRPARGVL